MLTQDAVQADRQERGIYELIAEALDERARIWNEEMPANAAEHLRRIGAEIAIDDAWDEYIGPMLDRMTEELGV
jgi:preprotein translocase subunit SecA